MENMSMKRIYMSITILTVMRLTKRGYILSGLDSLGEVL